MRKLGRDVGEELIAGVDADGRQHGASVGVGVRDVGDASFGVGLGDEGVVLLGGEQGVQLGGVGQAQADEPALGRRSDSFTSSGWSFTSSFTSTTSPATGE